MTYKIAYPYTKVGRLSLAISRKAHIKCADIVIDQAHINHIHDKHGKELQKLGMSAFDYIAFIVSNYNRIYRNADGSILLVVAHIDTSADTCCIQLHYLNGWWEIRTAQPRRKIMGTLLYTNKKSSPKTTFIKMSKS